MTATYKAVGWNRQKKIYDRTLGIGVVLYLAAFIGAALVFRPQITIETLLIRALGTAAFLLLHVVLLIGPLSRLDRRFLPLLYNRRHLGVTMFTLALGHGLFSIVQFHVLGDQNPLVSVLSANTRYDSLAQFPFQPLGLAALGILFLMAATSHDFWLHQLSAPTWKRLHMAVYAAYGLIVAHVVLGVLQAETSPVLAVTVGFGLALVIGVHLAAGLRERAGDRDLASNLDDGFIDACAVADLEDGRGKIVSVSGERVAIFRYDGKVSALSNACQHQNGPLGEGRILNGCIVCPWHGYEYLPHNGSSPPPFTEKVATFEARITAGRVLIDPRPKPPGTAIEPARIEPSRGPA